MFAAGVVKVILDSIELLHRPKNFCGLNFDAIIAEFTSKHLATLRHLSCVRNATSVVCLALALASLTSCSRQEPISRDELQSELRSAASIAAETNTFIEYVRQNRATDQYA